MCRQSEDGSPFTIVCAQCDAGNHITSYDQALAEGWARIEFAPDLPMANYVGVCPDCREDFEGLPQNDDVTQPD